MVQEPKEKEERKRVPLVMEQEVSPAPNKAFLEWYNHKAYVHNVTEKGKSLRTNVKLVQEKVLYGEEVVEVKIPAGVAEGMQLSVNGKGNAGKHNGVPGDLLVYLFHLYWRSVITVLLLQSR